jgi:dCMP deaminase
MERISRDEMLMRMAEAAAGRTDCGRAPRGVGALIAREGRPISAGYAAPPAGAEPCGATCNLDLPCTRTIHAEANAIYFAARHGLEVEGATIYCTTEPCLKCAEAIIQAGIKEVVYRDSYRDSNGAYLLTGFGVKIRRLIRE